VDPERLATLLDRHAAALALYFVAPEGGVIRRSTFGSRVWRPMLVRLELRHRGAHHLRHTFATLMLGAVSRRISLRRCWGTRPRP